MMTKNCIYTLESEDSSMPFSSTVDNVKHPQVATLGLMAMESASELGKKVDEHLQELYGRNATMFNFLNSQSKDCCCL